MPFAQANGLKLYYEQHGSGADVVLIMGHGLTHKFWDDQIPDYAKHYRCLVFDNRGVGQSDVTPRGFSIEDMAADTIGLLDAVGIRKAHIAGISMGGSIAMAMALKAPERIASLSLHSTMGRPYPAIGLRYRILIRITELGDADLWADMSAFTGFASTYINKNPEAVEKDILRRKNQRAGMSTSAVEGLIGQYMAFSTFDPFAQLGRISLPTLITVGSDDQVTPPSYAQDLQSKIPGSELVLFPGAPHRTTSFAKEEFNKSTLAFMAKHTAPAGRAR